MIIPLFSSKETSVVPRASPQHTGRTLQTNVLSWDTKESSISLHMNLNLYVKSLADQVLNKSFGPGLVLTGVHPSVVSPTHSI